MPQIINTNMASLNAQRNLDKSQAANQTALQRLSSGLRINSAKDDAAGMAISTRFTSQIKGLNVAVRNAGDGIALAQTAEGALGSMNDNLQRIRELAVQSANATNSDVDREALQAEVSQLISEITRTADETDFNGRKLLDGSFKATFQVGANAGQTLDINIAELTSSKLGSSMQAGVSAQGTDAKLGNGDLVINGQNIRSSVAGDDALSYKGKESSAISKAAAINASSDLSGVKATVDENVVLGSKIATADAGSAAVSGTIKLNGVEISIQGTDNTDEIAKAGTRNSVMAAINAKSGQTGVTAEDGGAAGGVILKAADGRNITLEATTPATTPPTDNDVLASLGLGELGTSHAGFTLTAANANTPIKIEGGNGTGNGDIANAGLKVGNYTAQTATTSSTSATVKSDLADIAQAISKDVVPPAQIGNVSPATDDMAGVIGTLADLDAALAAYDDAIVAAGETSAYSLGDIGAGGATISAFVAGTTTDTGVGGVQTQINAIATAMGVTGTYTVMLPGAGTGAPYVAGEETALSESVANVINQMVSDFNTAHPGDTALELNDTKLQAFLADLGVNKDGASGEEGWIGATPAAVDITTNTLGDLATALAGIEGITVPNSWQGDATALEDVSVEDLSKAFSTMQKDSPVALGTNRALQDGDLVINGVTIAASSALDDTASYTGAKSSDGAASAISIAAAINKSSDSTGVKANVNATEFVGGASTAAVGPATQGATMTLSVNGVDISLADQGDYEKNKAAAISAINERAGETGVTAKDNGESLTLTAADGRNISLYAESDAVATGGTATAETKASSFGLTGLDTVNSFVSGSVNLNKEDGATTVYGTVSLSSSKAFEVSYGTGGKEGLADSGLVAGKFGGGEDGQALTEIDISTFEGAQKALVAIDNAIGQVASQRADLGAVQNRMESTVSNLKVTSENLSAANSRIQDADFAAETAEMARTQILQQAGISVLAQANASGQNVLSLLG